MAGGSAAADRTRVTGSSCKLKCRMAQISMQRAYDRWLAHEVLAIRDGLYRPCLMHLFTTQMASWPRGAAARNTGLFAERCTAIIGLEPTEPVMASIKAAGSSNG